MGRSRPRARALQGACGLCGAAPARRRPAACIRPQRRRRRDSAHRPQPISQMRCLLTHTDAPIRPLGLEPEAGKAHAWSGSSAERLHTSGWPTQAACRAHRGPRQRMAGLCQLALGRAQRARVGARRVRQRRHARGGLAAARGRPAALVPLLQLQRLRCQALLRARFSISGLQARSAAQCGHSLAEPMALSAARAWCTHAEQRTARGSVQGKHAWLWDPGSFHGKPHILSSTAKATHTFLCYICHKKRARLVGALHAAQQLAHLAGHLVAHVGLRQRPALLRTPQLRMPVGSMVTACL